MDMPDFIDLTYMYPDVIYVYGHRSILDVLDRLLLMNSTSPQPLSYDTTFQLGDFYVSMLSFRHILFKEAEPVLLVCFLIHERMFQACHDQCFETCCKLIPSLHKCKKPTVIDEEHAFVNTVKSYLPPPQLRCWNHIMETYAVALWSWFIISGCVQLSLGCARIVPSTFREGIRRKVF